MNEADTPTSPLDQPAHERDILDLYAAGVLTPAARDAAAEIVRDFLIGRLIRVGTEAEGLVQAVEHVVRFTGPIGVPIGSLKRAGYDLARLEGHELGIEPEWHDGSFRPRLMLPLSLSYDHRLVDGADAARFLARLKDSLEQPLLMALEG